MNSIATKYGEATFQPLHDRVLVKRLPEPEPKGLIFIPECARDVARKAEVVAIGKKVSGVNLGAIVLLPGVAAKYPDWEDSELMLIQEADIGGVLSEDQQNAATQGTSVE